MRAGWLRATIVALVALAAADVRLAGPRREEPALLVLDVSASLGDVRAPAAPRGRRTRVVFAATARTLDEGEAGAGIDRERTRIAAGLAEAARVLGDVPGTALLVTDGRDTGDDALAAAAAFSARGHRLYVAPPAGGIADVGLLSARATTSGAVVRVEARVASSTSGTATVVLRRGGRRVDAKPVALGAGRPLDVVLVDASPPASASTTPDAPLEVLVEPGPGVPDDDPLDDRLSVPVRDGARRALVLGPWADPGAGGEVATRAVARVEPADLDGVDVLVVSGVPRRELPGADVVARFLGRGGRLLVLGGPDAYAGGGWSGSAFEALLPLRSKPPEAPERALVVALDRSGSTSEPLPTGGDRLARLRQAVRALVEDLAPGESVAVVPFSDAASPPLAPGWVSAADAGARAALLASLSAVAAGGGTDLPRAVVAAARMLAGSAARERRVVLLTDGDPDHAPTAEAFAPARDALDAASARLVGLVTGDPATVAALRAAAGEGADVVDVASVEAVEAALARAVRDLRAKGEREDGPFRVSVAAGAGEDVRGLAALAPSAMARLVAAPGASVLATAAKGAATLPFAAERPVGAGRVVAVAWGPAWEPALRGAAAALAPLLARLAAEAERGLEAAIHDGRIVVRAEAAATRGSLRVTRDDGEEVSWLVETAPGTFEGAPSGAVRPGEALWVVVDGTRRPLRLPATPPPEHAGVGVDEAMLDALARAGGGRVLAAGATAPSSATPQRIRLAPVLLLVALALLVLERVLATAAVGSTEVLAATRRGAA